MKEYLTVREHAWKLHLIFEAIYIHDENKSWLHIKDWLHMASGVINTEIDTQYYDTSTIFCSPARDYERNKSKLWSLFCKELVTFNFIWGSLEALIESITDATENDSKPYAGIKYLRGNYKAKPIEKYACILNSLLKHMKKSNYNYSENIYKYCSTNNSGSGLHLVTKIRNSFAHGSQQIPNSDDWVANIRNEISIIVISSRMLLLTIQMLLIAHFFNKQIILEHVFMFDELLDYERVPLDSLLNTIHLLNYETLLNF